MNIKHIAATLAILGSASFTMTGCKKEGTEVPAGDEKKAEGSCGEKKDGACSGEKKEGSCSGEKKEGAEGDAAPADAPAEPPAE
jgi:uncharacterized low-complexity protein